MYEKMKQASHECVFNSPKIFVYDIKYVDHVSVLKVFN